MRPRSTAVLVALVTAAHLCVIAAPALAVTADAGRSPSTATAGDVTGSPDAPEDLSHPPPRSAAIPQTVTARLDRLPGTVVVDAPGSARAAAVPTGAEPGTVVSAPVEAPIPFAMVGLELPAGATARVRTSDDGASWGGWMATDRLVVGDDGPDASSIESAQAQDAGRFTQGLWVGGASWLQVELRGADPSEVGASFIDTLGLAAGGDAVAAAATEVTAGELSSAAVAMPGVVSRAGWGADESLRSGSPSYADGVRYAVIHHTAGTNSYTEREAPAVVRGIYAYHTTILGWSDIGYNVLVDRYGNIYEGRAGGLENAVIGAHAQGFNTGSLGVSVLGEFTSSAPPQRAFDAVSDVVAWVFRRHGVSPAGSVLITSGGSTKYPAGMQVPMSTIFGHRDAGETECPGNAYYARLPALRMTVAARIPQLAPPAPSGPGAFSDIGGSVHAGSISALARAGIAAGCGGGRFCPDQHVTRGQAVSLLIRAKGWALEPGQHFSDVPTSHTHAGAIAAAVAAGWIAGYGDGTFRPEAPLSREQLATVLGRASGLRRQTGQVFVDVGPSSPHFQWVNALGGSGVSGGCGGGRYCPAGTASRAQMASLVAAAFRL